MAVIELPATLGGEPVHDMTAMCYEMLGSAMTRGDAEGGWLLLKLIDSMCHHFKPVWDLVLDNELRPGGWDLFNPGALRGQQMPWLPWLSQFTGDYYDPSTNGLDPSSESPDQVNRDKVAHLRNWRRGTLPVLEETLVERLPGGVVVTIAENFQDSQNHLHITVYVSADIPQRVEGSIFQAVAASIPAGDTFDLDILTSPSFAANAASMVPSTFATRQVRYPRFADLPKVHEQAYQGQLPWQATSPAVTTWAQWQTLFGSWANITAYGSWEAIETAGDILALEGP